MAAITATPTELIRGALLKLGAVDRERALTGTEKNDGLISLNRMLASWSINKLKIPAITKESFSLVVGQSSYTIGDTGADVTSTRPQTINAAYIRDAASTDFVLEIIGREEYNEAFYKAVSERPYKLYYHPTSPNGTIYLDTQPAVAETLFIDSQKALASITDPDVAIVLPDSYHELIEYHLAIRIAPEYQMSVRPELSVVASDLMSEIQNLNSEPFEAELDYALII